MSRATDTGLPVGRPVGPFRGRKLLTLCLGLVAVGLAALVVGRGFGSPPRFAGPVHLVRGTNGTFDRAPLDEALTDAFLQAQASTLRSNTTSTFSTYDSPRGLPALPLRRLTVFLDGDHPLLHRAAAVVLERLMDQGPFDELDLYPVDQAPEPGGPAADLVMVMQVPTVTSSGVLREDVQATLRAVIGTNLVSALLKRPLAEFLPWNDFRMSLEVGYGSRFTGVRTGSMEWQLQGTELGEQVAEALIKNLAGPRRAQGTLARFPDSLVPDYEPAPEFRFLGGNARSWSSTHGLFTVNESVWECPLTEDPAVFHAQVTEELLAQGWARTSEDDEPGVSVTFTQGTRELLVREDDRAHWVLYRERLTEQEQRLRLSAILEQGDLDESYLVLFHTWWSEEQESVIREHFAAHPPRTDVAWLYSSRLHQRVGDTEAAIRSLQVARLLASLRNAYDSLKSPWESQAKEVGLDPEAELVVDRALLRAAGVIPFPDEDPGHGETEIGIGELALFCDVGEEGEAPVLHVVSVTRNGPFYDVCVAGGTGVRLGSSTAIGVTLSEPRDFHHGRNGVQYKTRLEPLEGDGEHYRVLVTRTGR